MRRLCAVLGFPQRRFASIHVVGTNGKTSVTRMTSALLEAHGVSAGAYISPHIASWRERVLIGDEPISEEAFTEALDRADQAAQVADRAAGEEGPVTQFELLTAAAFFAFATARVQFAVVEAGLGGRLDATNVIPSKLTVLTSVGLDHTEWLGETLEEIAGEKVAVLRDHTELITGELPAEVWPVIEQAAKEHHARAFLVQVKVGGQRSFHDLNQALAESAVQEALGWLDPMAVIAIRKLRIPGRGEVVAGNPPAIFDAAHNPDGARALAASLPTLATGRDVVCCLAILDGKDAAGIIDELAPACSRFVCTEIPPERIEGSGRPGGRSRPALELAALCRKAGWEAEAIADPLAAWARARELAREQNGVALAAGSHYLLSSIWTERPAQSS